MVFYDYLLNIDTQPFENSTRGSSTIESIVIRLEDVKKLLGLLK